jgi:hypothetical protein
MTEILAGLQNFARVVDDTVIYVKDAEEHTLNVIRLLRRCREKKLRINVDKFVLKQKDVPFAGLILTPNGFTIDPKVTESLRNLPEPRTPTDWRSFHDLANQLAPYDREVTAKLARKPKLPESQN